jgi:VIT1/CCC1 family predicted Fe2+/Mn2+ transporter
LRRLFLYFSGIQLYAMINGICLNCGSEVHSRYCSECGQKAATSRITLKHFVQHDLMHGFWHLDKGLVFTLKEALVRPGQAALDYIYGKRVRYYNVFYLALLMIGLNLILKQVYASITGVSQPPENEVVEFLTKHIKVMLLCGIPLMAINARLIFRRLKLNMAEHLIIGGFALIGVLFFTILFYFSDVVMQILPVTFGVVKMICFLGIVFFPMWAYSNLCRKRYRKWGILWRVLLFEYLLIVELVILLMVIFYFFTGKSEIYISI